MTEIRLKQYLVTVRVGLAEDIMLQHSPSSPVVIGNELALQIHEYAKQHQLGYYPALDFFAMNPDGQGGVDPDLIDAAESMSWLLCRLVRQEFQTRLRQVFSQVRFQSVQTMAYTMPPVRYGANNSLHDLALHYTPLNVKLDCVLSMISKNQPEDGVEAFVGSVLQRWLKDSFESTEVSSVMRLNPS